MTIDVEMKTHNVMSYRTHQLQCPDSLFLDIAFLHYIPSISLKTATYQQVITAHAWIGSQKICSAECAILLGTYSCCSKGSRPQLFSEQSGQWCAEFVSGVAYVVGCQTHKPEPSILILCSKDS